MFTLATTAYTLTASNASRASRASALVGVSVTSQPTPAPFAALSVVATFAPPNFTGFCSKDFDCSAAISVNGPGTVTYRWERSDGGSRHWQAVSFTSAGTKVVTTGWSRDALGDYRISVRTLSSNHIVEEGGGLQFGMSEAGYISDNPKNCVPVKLVCDISCPDIFEPYCLVI